MLADLGQKLCFPFKHSTNLQPDFVIWSASLKLIYIIELMVPCGSSVEVVLEGKRLRYGELAAYV